MPGTLVVGPEAPQGSHRGPGPRLFLPGEDGSATGPVRVSSGPLSPTVRGGGRWRSSRIDQIPFFHRKDGLNIRGMMTPHRFRVGLAEEGRGGGGTVLGVVRVSTPSATPPTVTVVHRPHPKVRDGGFSEAGGVLRRSLVARSEVPRVAAKETCRGRVPVRSRWTRKVTSQARGNGVFRP